MTERFIVRPQLLLVALLAWLVIAALVIVVVWLVLL
jgi:hypothetical protein